MSPWIQTTLVLQTQRLPKALHYISAADSTAVIISTPIATNPTSIITSSCKYLHFFFHHANYWFWSSTHTKTPDMVLVPIRPNPNMVLVPLIHNSTLFTFPLNSEQNYWRHYVRLIEPLTLASYFMYQNRRSSTSGKISCLMFEVFNTPFLTPKGTFCGLLTTTSLK